MRETKKGSIKEQIRAEVIANDTSVVNIIRDIRVKDRLEKQAFEALERRLTPKTAMCRPCRGEGYKSNGDTCAVCQGSGAVVEDADMRAIELVLSPKFPKTQINVNADLDNMDAQSLLDMIEGI